MPATANLFIPQTFRLHRGYFELDGRGVMDIRELGLLELLNAGADDQSYANAIDYAKTFEDLSRPEYERQAKRLEIFQQTLGGAKNVIKVVGNTRRLIMSKEFVKALFISFGEAGLSYQGDLLRTNNGTTNRGAQYLNGAILASNLGSPYVTTGNNMNNANGFNYVSPSGQHSVW
jgi:hypothetical protein